MANKYNDPSCIAAYLFEPDALTVDDRGNTVLQVHEDPVIQLAPASDGARRKQGLGSVDFESTSKHWYYVNDADLPSSFPLKYGRQNYSFSFTCWFNMESESLYPRPLFSKESSGGYPEMAFFVNNAEGYNTLIELYVQQTGGIGYDTVLLYKDEPFTLGAWYFVAVTYDELTRQGYLYLWKDGVGIVDTTVWTRTVNDGDLVLTEGPFCIGEAKYLSVRYFDGLIDELLVFNRALSNDEIVAIKDGTYEWVGWTGAVIQDTALSGTLLTNTLAPMLPSWRDNTVIETMQFGVDVQQAADAAVQQRVSFDGGTPGQTFTCELVTTEVAKFKNVLQYWLNKSWGVPVWPEAVLNEETLGTGATEINVDTRYGDFRDDGLALLWQNDRYEILNVSSVSASKLTLSLPTAHAWSGQKFVMPLRTGFLIDAVTSTQYDNAVVAKMKFLVADPAVSAAASGHVADLEYDSYEVLVRSHVRDDPYELQSQSDLSINDDKIGVIQAVANSEYNSTSFSCTWRCDSPAEVWWLRQLFHALKGPQAAVLIPTWERDFTLSQAAASDATTLTVTHCDASSTRLPSMRDYLGVIQNGAVLPRKITGVVETSAVEEVITLDAATGVGLSVGQAICFLDKCRLVGDVTFQWLGRGQCDVLTTWERVTE